MDVRGIGLVGGQKLLHEVFYRSFNNRREVGSFLGLVNSPYDSGSTRRDQGISKAGNPRVRSLAVELAWLWLRFQPDSELSRWFRAPQVGARGTTSLLPRSTFLLTIPIQGAGLKPALSHDAYAATGRVENPPLRPMQAHRHAVVLAI